MDEHYFLNESAAQVRYGTHLEKPIFSIFWMDLLFACFNVNVKIKLNVLLLFLKGYHKV